MTAADLFARAAKREISLFVRDGHVRFRAPEGAMTSRRAPGALIVNSRACWSAGTSPKWGPPQAARIASKRSGFTARPTTGTGASSFKISASIIFGLSVLPTK